MASPSRPALPPHLRLLSPRQLPPLRPPRRRGARSRVLSALPSPSPSPPSQQRVSTASLEHGPGPGPSAAEQQPRPHDQALAAEVARLSAARARLRAARTLGDKLRALDAEPRVAAFFGDASSRGVLGGLRPREAYLLKCLVAAGQDHVLGAELGWAGAGGHERHRNGGGGGSALREALYSLADLVGRWSEEGAADDEAGSGETELLLGRLLKFLGDIEEFYDCVGGIIGYQIMALELLSVSKSKDSKHRHSKDKFVDFHVPTGLNLLEDTEYASQAALWGIEVITNVVAATDLTLMALAGIGLRHNKKLGFASCERRPGATEGVNVLIEKQNLDGLWEYGITCIEYTEFEKYGISEPTATNGSAAGGRLECTMQNIADNFMNTYSYRCSKGIESELDTFIVYNERKKVTSSAKRKLKSEDRSLHQTPEGSLLDIMRNAHDLLSSCSIEVPEVKDNNEYLHSGLPFIIFLHPALGPFWDIVKQKFIGGSISKGSELQIEVAEFLWQDVELDGSLIILADNIMGSTKRNTDGEQVLHYGARYGRCKLQNVKIVNEGISWDSPSNVYWQHHVERSESLKIILHGNAEFEAKDVVLKGNHMFEVPDGHRMCIIQDEAGFTVKLDPISKEMMDSGTWYWEYTLDGAHVKLNMVDLCGDGTNCRFLIH
ncbi:hypothetical protein VPH35_015774 [Triticum aestivum]